MVQRKSAVVTVRHVVVGVDGSPNSLAALDWALELAGRVDAQITAVHAVGLLERFEDDGPAEPAWAERLRHAGPRGGRVVRHGPPATVLASVADELDADLVVIGRRGAGIAGLTLGSTSLQLAHDCARPVTVIPQGPIT